MDLSGSADINGATQKGLLSSKTDGNQHVTRYTYTARNEPYQTVYADGTSESIGTTPINGYDGNGNVLMRIKPDGKAITYTYDADNRLTDITYPTLHATHFDYDGDGRRKDMIDATGETYWTYGDGVHLTQVQTPYGSSTQTVGYAYYLGGQRKIMSLVGLGSWNYGYFPGGELQTLTNPYNETATYSYDAGDRVTRRINGDGTYANFHYDVADQQTDIWHYTSGNGLQGYFHYDYTPGGDIKILTQNYNVTTAYGYDGADQLTSEAHSGDATPYTLGFGYDGNGNRLTQTKNGAQTQKFTYDGHDKIASALGESDTYDANGNLKTVSVGGSVYTYAWDDEDRLTSLATPSGTATYTYNGLGLRTGKTDPTGTYLYVCDGTSPASPVLADGQAVYTPGLSDHRGGASTFTHADALGSLRFLTNSGQTPTASLLSDAFGETVASDPLSTPFGWNGGSGYGADWDGLSLVGHRYYDSRTGRFVSQDPAGDGDNWYAYCGNDPVNHTDPEGLWVPQNGEWSVNGGVMSDAAAAFGHLEAVTSGLFHSDGRWMHHFLPSYNVDAHTTVIPGFNYWQPGDQGLFDGVGGAFGVGLSAVGSAASFHLWNGGAARHDPSFGVSSVLADIGVGAATAALGGEAAEGASGCFTAGTPVQTQGGMEPIQDIHAGEMVATRDPQTGRDEYRKVVRTFAHPASETVTAEFADAATGQVVEAVTATPEHSFYVLGLGFVPLGSLGVGAQVVTRDGPPLVVASVARHGGAAGVPGVIVYNLEVEGDHTYFVGDADGGLWVHNNCFSGDQQALIDLAKEAQQKGVAGVSGISRAEADTLVQWGKEYGFKRAAIEAHSNRAFGQFLHAVIGGVRHIWIQP